MKFYVVKIDETQYLSDAAKATVGTYHGYYLFTDDEEVFCAELTPSYWLEACGFETEHYDEDIYEDLERCLYDSSHYRHCKAVDKTPKELFGEFDSIEEAVECFHANPRYF